MTAPRQAALAAGKLVVTMQQLEWRLSQAMRMRGTSEEARVWELVEQAWTELVALDVATLVVLAISAMPPAAEPNGRHRPKAKARVRKPVVAEERSHG